jgi:hypothetical protein
MLSFLLLVLFPLEERYINLVDGMFTKLDYFCIDKLCLCLGFLCGPSQVEVPPPPLWHSFGIGKKLFILNINMVFIIGYIMKLYLIYNKYIIKFNIILL